MIRARRAAPAVGFAALACAAATAAQALTPVSQERRVHVHIDAFDINFGPFVSDENVAAPDFAPFSAGVDGWPSPPFPAIQTTFENSTIGTRELHATGSFEATAGSGSVGTYVRKYPEFVYVVSFDVAEPTPFTLTGFLALELQGCDADTQGRIRLTGPAGVVTEVAERFSGYPDLDLCIGCQTSLPIDTSGVLAPGSYTLGSPSASG